MYQSLTTTVLITGALWCAAASYAMRPDHVNESPLHDGDKPHMANQAAWLGSMEGDAPFVDILNTNAVVPFDEWMYTLDGTNNDFVVGGMVWTNLLGGSHDEFLAVSPWTIGNIWLEEGDNIIIVAGTNLMGIIAADTVTVTRLPEPLPVIAITNAIQILPFGTTNAMIGGCYSNITQVMWWSNDRDGEEFMIPAAGQAGWFVIQIANLQPGTNIITVRGWSQRERPAEDRTTIIVDWPRPFVDILTTNTTVPFDEWLFPIDGTNNAAVVGEMWWTNLLSGSNDKFPAVSPWSIESGGGVWLDVGDNIIIVAGTNLVGIVAADTVTVTRLPEPLPVIAITNETQILPFGTTDAMIGGCYSNIMEVMWWSNDRDGEGHMLNIEGLIGWFAVAITNLQSGTNIITVQGSSLYGRYAQDRTTIIVDWPQPIVDITNTPGPVPYELDAVVIAGTNDNLAGAMAWQVNNGALHWFDRSGLGWAVAVQGLAHGWNTVSVYGTNEWERWTNAAVQVYRQGTSDIQPFVDILSTNTTVPFDEWLCTLDGTNNAAVVGTMVWTNLLGGSHDEFLAVSPWTIGSVWLEVGDNVIVVAGTNLAGIAAADTVTVTRLPEPLPVIDITNATQLLPAGTTDAMVGGCYSNIVQVMWWSNDRDGEEHALPVAGQIGWFTVAITNLQTGTNIITVRGMSPRERPAQDTTTIIVDWPRPFVDITNATPQIVDVPWVVVGGTNNAGTYLVCCSNERTGYVQQPFAWNDSMVNLSEGEQTLAVQGTNALGFWTADWHRVTYRVLQPDIAISGPAGLITNGGTYAFGQMLTGVTQTASFWIDNIGAAPLTCQPVVVTGPGFALVLQPQSVIVAGARSRFDVAATPLTTSVLVGTSSVANNVAGKTPYVIHLTATPIIPGGAAGSHVWYSLARVNGSVRCRFHYNSTDSFSPGRDDIRLQINDTECLTDVALADPYYWHYRHANTSYSFRNKVPGSGRIVIMLDTRRQHGAIFVKKLLLPTCADTYLPVRLTLGALASVELPCFAGATKGTREHFNAMGYRSNIFVVAGTRVRYRKSTPRADDVLTLQGMCMTNPAVVLPKTFTAQFTWGVCGSARTNIFLLSMQREPDNVCRSTDAGNVHATMALARGRWRLQVGGLELEQAAAAGPIALHAALQLDGGLIVFDERTEYTATVLAKQSKNIVY